MYRAAIYKWKENKYRKPLIIEGAITEQYVLQQLITNPNLNIYYYTNQRGSSEFTFICD